MEDTVIKDDMRDWNTTIEIDFTPEEENVEENPTSIGDDAVWFNGDCPGWSRIPEMNKLFLLEMQRFFNEKLQRVGHLFINEVLDYLGLPKTMRGQVVGWVYNDEIKGYVDFGIYKDHNANFINGKTPNALLDFNVDGNILGYL